MQYSFEPNFNIPKFLLTVTEIGRNRKSSFGKTFKTESPKNGIKLEVSWEGIANEPSVFQEGNLSIIVIGSPIFDSTINRQKAAELAKQIKIDKTQKAVEFDGEFLIIVFDSDSGELRIINDRFNSVPFYYYPSESTKIFAASIFFRNLWDYLDDSSLLKINEEAFFEFLWFQRLLGVKTLALGAYYLPDASVFQFQNWQFHTSRYWKRNYTKNSDSLKENAVKLSKLVERSVEIKTCDHVKYGHFLSGGMDSRTVLSAFKRDIPTCFTVGISVNREVRTAMKIAAAKSAPHVFLQLDPEHYGMIRKAAVRLCGGLYNYDHAIFLGFDKAVRENAKVCFSGYGFDFMFQGMYIPGKNVKVGGHVLYLRKMLKLPADISTYFISNASYRIKDADIFAFIRNDKLNSLVEFQKNSVNEVLRRARELSDDACDIWEFLTFHFITRHYSYPNVMAIASFAEARTISFTNDIFNLYLSLPASQRFNGAIEKEALKILDPSIAKIWSANTNLPVTASPSVQTAYQLARAAKRRLTFQKDYEEWRERTWPSREYALKNQSTLKNAALEIINSGILETLKFLDHDKIRKTIPRWLNGEKIPGISGDLVQTLVSIGTHLG